MVKVLNFRSEGLGFDSWQECGDCTLGEGALDILLLLHPEVQRSTDTCLGGKPVTGCHTVQESRTTLGGFMK